VQKMQERVRQRGSCALLGRWQARKTARDTRVWAWLNRGPVECGAAVTVDR
jgi:hypothetical protein